MNNRVIVNDIHIEENKFSCDFSAYGEIEKCFLKNRFEAEYNFDLTSIPKSILIIPFLGDILPLIWLYQAELIVDEVDADFLREIEKAKNGFREMYPMLSFGGEILTRTVKNNSLSDCKKVGCFFSGGVDAFATLYSHLDEKPLLITIWGSDIKLDDIEGWNNVECHVKKTAEDFGLEYTRIKSNFRGVINEKIANQKVKKSGDGWWHGFSCGMGLICHAAIIAYKYGLKSVYIASSFPAYLKGQYTCGSDPIIDNHIDYAGCSTVHDGYEMNRQQKVQYILERSKYYGIKPHLRVCWESRGGKNCCHCEKCYRTILEIVSENGDPNELGFIWNRDLLKKCREDFEKRIDLPKSRINGVYKDISNAFETKFSGDRKDYEWLFGDNLKKMNDTPIRRFKRSFLYRGGRKVFRKINKRISGTR